jgi:polysaccharide export outer membrane protein
VASPPAELDMEHRILPRDVLSVAAFDEPDISGEFPVAQDGTINHPLLGRVPLAGQTVAAAQKTLWTLLEKDYLVNPRITVAVVRSVGRRVFVAGEVQKPGAYAMEPDETMTVIRLMSLAGGLKPTAAPAQAGILRLDGTRQRAIAVDLERLHASGGGAGDVPLQSDDVLVVPQAEGRQAVILGEVRKPGSYPIPAGQPVTLVGLISQAGGFTELAAPGRVRVVRQEGGNPRTMLVDVGAVLKGDARDKDLPLQAGDVVMVPQSLF